MRYTSILTRISGLAVLALWVYAVVVVMQMPETVPIHFDTHNDADNFGSRYTYLIMPAIATAILGLFELIKLYPQHINYPVEITAANHEKQQDLALSLLSTIGLVLPILFFYVIHTTKEYIESGSMDFSIVLFLSLVFVPIIIYFILARKHR